jgi:DNA-binding transcriptional LysR family regulator
MNLHALRIFMMAASQKSVTAAAKIFSISQPAVTIQIRNLEKDLELKLIEPSGRGIQLTPAGKILFQQACYLFDIEQSIEAKMKDLRYDGIGTLRIASTYLPANFLLPQWLAHLKRNLPEIKVDLYSGNSAEVLEQLTHYKADVAFVVKEKWNQPDIRLCHLMDMEFWFIVPSDHRFNGKEVSLSDLAREPFLFREKGSSTREILFALCRVHGVAPPSIGLQFHGLNESIHSVAAGYGVMLAPSLAVRRYVENKEVGRVWVKGIEIRRPIYFCKREAEQEVPRYEMKFLEIIEQDLKDKLWF